MMQRRSFLGAALGAAGTWRLGAQESSTPLNVLFIAVDDLRPELGCYGNDTILTPNIDGLARRSLRFENAYCQSAVCGPSRASLITGLRPDTTKIWGNKTHFRATIPDLVTLPQSFLQAGYYTQSIGKVLHGNTADRPSWSVPAWPAGGRQAGMQYVDEEQFRTMKAAHPSRVWDGPEIPTLEWTKLHSWQAPDAPDNALQDGQVADRSIQSLHQHRDEPFFLGVGFQKPHLPFTAPGKYFDLYDPAELPMPKDAQRPVGAPPLAFTRWQELRGYTDIPREGPLPPGKTQELIHGYYAATSYMDAQAGRVLDALEDLGLAERTVVMFFGDHGWHLGEHDLWAKTMNLEIDARSPLMLHVPGMRTGGQSCDRLVELIDMYPTLCEACQVKASGSLEGLSMMPLLENPQQPWKSAAFTQIPRPYLANEDWEHMGYSIRTDRHRYTEWVTQDGTLAERELYDLANSRLESVNLAGQPESRPLVAELSAQLKAGWRAALPPTSN